jgi:hypothetical protein
MTFQRIACGLAFALIPGPALAHDAFGNLGPFYQGLLHPVADPAQGLLLVAAAVLLARQPVASVRKAYLALLLCGVIAIAVHFFVTVPPLKTQVVGALAAVLGGLALTGVSLPVMITVALAGGVAILSGLSGDQTTDFRNGLLAGAGMSIGAPLLVLFLWCFLDFLQKKLGRVAGAVAGSWVAAVGVMTAALPATLS